MSTGISLEHSASNAAVTAVKVSPIKARSRQKVFARLAFCRLSAARWASVGNTLWASEYRREADMLVRSLGLRRKSTLECHCRNHEASVREEIESWPRMLEVIRRESRLTADDYNYG